MTESDKYNCAKRELKMRKAAYPRFVAAGRMSQEKADQEIECMAAIVEDYRKICEGERLI